MTYKILCFRNHCNSAWFSTNQVFWVVIFCVWVCCSFWIFFKEEKNLLWMNEWCLTFSDTFSMEKAVLFFWFWMYMLTFFSWKLLILLSKSRMSLMCWKWKIKFWLKNAEDYIHRFFKKYIGNSYVCRIQRWTSHQAPKNGLFLALYFVGQTLSLNSKFGWGRLFLLETQKDHRFHHHHGENP